MKYKLMLGLILLTSSFCFAQRIQVLTYRKVAGDSAKTKKEKKMIHYVGVQANQLLSQLFNFNNSSTAVNNPYLIVYSMNSIETGWGLNAGLGYSINTTTDDSDPNTTRKTTLNNFSLRAGIEKKSFLSKKWLASYGFDVLWSKQGDDATNTSQSQFDVSSSEVNSSTRHLGFGPRFGLNYFISDKIILGTEATYYFRFSKVSDTITNTDNNSGVVNSSSTTTSQHLTDLTFTVPVAIFLIVKL
jgi:hypothetical protein